MGFEEGDMKNIVNPEVGWKGEPKGDGICCMPGWTSRNTGVYPTLLQRGGKDWMLYTRKIIMIKHRRRQD